MARDLNVPGRQRIAPHTVADVQRAIRAVDQPGWNGLHTAARDSLRRCRLDDPARDHEDLVQEAFVRLLSGSRSWRRGIGFEYQVARVMDSIACDWRRRVAENPEIRELELTSSDVGDEDVASPLPDPPSPERSIEDRRVAAGEAQEVAKLFADDAAALQVLGCMVLELTRHEMRERTQMSDKQLKATIRRVRRRAERFRSDRGTG